MGKGGTVLGIIGILLAVGAIGFAFVAWNGQNDLESDFNNLTQTKVVGIWDTLDDNLDYAPYDSSDYWLFEFGDSPFNNTDYISVSNSNTRITLLTPGWYRIHLLVLLTGISPGCSYLVELLKDGNLHFYFFRHESPATGSPYYHPIDAFGFVYSDGTNYIEIHAWSSGDISFSSNAVDSFNQLTIEYVDT